MNEGHCYRENNNNNGGTSNCCYVHPKEMVVGVCHLCLNERLLILAAKQGLKGSQHQSSSKLRPLPSNKSKPSISFQLPSKIFALGSLLSRRDDIRHRHRRRKSDHQFADEDPDTTSTSLEDDSFISIKFGDNGVASWDKSSNTVISSKVPLEDCSVPCDGQTSVKHADTNKLSGRDNNSNSNNSNKSVVERAMPRAPLRWRKRIGQLLQVIRWNKSTKANRGGGNSKGEGVKVVRNNKGWIRTLRIRTKE